jgi:uncharacterized protein (DUF58 family)
MMALLLVCGLYSGERIYFAGLFVLTFILLISAVSVLYTGISFKYLQSLTPREGVKGDTLEYKLEIHNDMVLPMPYITLYYDDIESLLAGGQASATLSLMPRTHGECAQSIFCRYRGRWPVGVKKVEIRDFFNLLSVRLDATKFLSHKTISLLVRPRVLHLDRLPMRRKNDEGPMETAPRSSDEAAMLSDIRKYRAGDQLKKIHWKLTARQREVMVKNYEETSLPDLLLYMDVRGADLPLLERLNLEDTLVECATAVVHYLLRRHLPTSLIFYSAKRTQIRGSRPDHFQAFYSLLSEMPFDGRFPAEDVLTNDLKLITQSGNLFLVVWSISDQLYNLLMLMNSSGINITVIFVYGPQRERETAPGAAEPGSLQRMISEMRNAGISVINLSPGDSIVERVSVLT